MQLRAAKELRNTQSVYDDLYISVILEIRYFATNLFFQQAPILITFFTMGLLSLMLSIELSCLIRRNVLEKVMVQYGRIDYYLLVISLLHQDEIFIDVDSPNQKRHSQNFSAPSHHTLIQTIALMNQNLKKSMFWRKKSNCAQFVQKIKKIFIFTLSEKL